MRDRRLRAETLVRVEQERAPHVFVGGLDVQSEGSATIEVRDAADGTALGRCPVAHPRDVEKAAQAAGRAATALDALGPEGRGAALEALAALIEEHGEDLAILECLQTGRTFREVLRDDIEGGASALRAAAAGARHPRGAVHELGAGSWAWVELAPRPVVGAVLPAAEPLGAALRKIALAIGVGSGLVLLAPAEAPLGVLRLGALTREAGLPPGAVNVLTSDGREGPERMAACPEIDLLVYAGPRDVARHVVVGAARSNLKQLVLELDDKTPCIVLEDAEIGRAVEILWRSALSGTSQLGRGIGRALIHASMYRQVAGRLVDLAKATVLGHPLDEHTELGPLASEARMRRVLAYVELGRREGAKLVAGGARDIEGPRFAGRFVQPTVFLEPPFEGRLAREPIEGPVLTLEPFHLLEDALDRAATCLGRTAAVLVTRDLGRAREVARRVPAGQVFVNGPVRLAPVLPHAGAGEMSAPTSGRAGAEALGFLRTVVVSG